MSLTFLLQKYIDNTIRIPMKPTLRSLNLSNSVAIVAFEVLRQKQFENLEEISSYFDWICRILRWKVNKKMGKVLDFLHFCGLIYIRVNFYQIL